MAFPFLRFGTGKDPADEEPFHRILVERMPLGSGYPRQRAWTDRCDAHPRA